MCYAQAKIQVTNASYLAHDVDASSELFNLYIQLEGRKATPGDKFGIGRGVDNTSAYTLRTGIIFPLIGCFAKVPQASMQSRLREERSGKPYEKDG
jgi:hypothetical protein